MKFSIHTTTSRTIIRFIGAFALLSALQACSEPGNIKETTPQNFDYKANATDWPKCDTPRPAAGAINTDGTKSASIPATGQKFKTKGGIEFYVKVPANYKPSYKHPLLMLYAPGGRSAAKTDRYYKITADATARGFVVVVADDKRPSIEALEDLGSIPTQVSEHFCINKKRVFATGHSNGGLVSNAVAFLPKLHNSFTAIAPSAGGIRKQDIEVYKCPSPLPVMVLHNKNDGLFPPPKHGIGVAEYWAKCNGCDATPIATKIKTCTQYPNCTGGVTTLFCEGPGGHIQWPDMNNEILNFLTSASKP